MVSLPVFLTLSAVNTHTLYVHKLTAVGHTALRRTGRPWRQGFRGARYRTVHLWSLYMNRYLLWWASEVISDGAKTSLGQGH